MFFLNFEKWVVLRNLYCPLPVLWTKYEKEKIKKFKNKREYLFDEMPDLPSEYIFIRGCFHLRERKEWNGRKKKIWFLSLIHFLKASWEEYFIWTILKMMNVFILVQNVFIPFTSISSIMAQYRRKMIKEHRIIFILYFLWKH